MKTQTVLLLFALLTFVEPVCRGQAAPASAGKRPMTFEDMMSMKRLGDTAVSPDGKWLGYAVTTVNLAANSKTTELWVQAIAGGEPVRVSVAEPNDSGIEFAPDGKRILFLSGRSGTVQVWLADFNPATGATTNARRLTGIATGADDAIWAPDGKSIAFTSFVYPNCPAITTADFDTGNKCNADRDAALAASPVKAQIFTHLLFRHWDHYMGDKRSHLFLVSVADGTMRDLNPGDVHDIPPFSLEGGGCGCAFAPDSKELAFTEKDVPNPAISTSAAIFTLDLTDPAAKPVKVSTSAGGNFSPAYSPDGKWLAWRSQARAGYESDRFRLVIYDRSAKTIRDVLEDAKLPNTAPAHFNLWVDEFAWAPDSRSIYFAAGDKGEEPIYKIYLLDGELRRLGKAVGDWSDVHPVLINGDQFIVGSLARVDRPPEVVIADLFKIDDDSHVIRAAFNSSQHSKDITPATYNPPQITHLNDALLSQLDLSPMEPFWFTAKDGTKVEGFIVKPPGFDASKKYPVKFLIHGGPQGAWDESWSYRWNPELFAANGYVVVMVNPRGSTGYGQAFIDGVNGDWGGKPYTDLMQGLDYAEQHYAFIDKTRECALGASYGGYMADWVLGHTDRFKCIVTHDGMFDPEGAYGSTDELWFMEWEFKGKPWDYYGKPDAEDPYRRWAPMLYAKNFKTPTLVVHGQLDYRLDVSQGFELFTTLQRLGVPSKMLYFPNEGHWVLKPQDSQLWWKTVNDWVDEWTGEKHGSRVRVQESGTGGKGARARR